MRFIKPIAATGGGGGVELPALTTPASAGDIASGKEAIDGEGNKLTGSITEKSLFYAGGCVPTDNETMLTLDAQNPSDFILRKNKWLTLASSLTNLGDAATSDVVAGKTFTSTAGVKATGTLAEETTLAPTLSELMNIGTDIFVMGKNAGRKLVADDADVTMIVPTEQFGNATPSDVAAGKTFTAQHGLLSVGTAVMNKGMVKTFTISGTTGSCTIDGLGDFSNFIMCANNRANHADSTRVHWVVKKDDTISAYAPINNGSTYYYTGSMSGDTLTLGSSKYFADCEWFVIAYNA